MTKIEIDPDRIVLQLNGGYSGGLKWYRNVQSRAALHPALRIMQPIRAGSDANAPGGASITLMFPHPLEPVKADEIKKMLAPILDFEKHSAAEVYAESLPPEMKAALKEGRVVEGMERDQVVLAMGQPRLSLTGNYRMAWNTKIGSLASSRQDHLRDIRGKQGRQSKGRIRRPWRDLGRSSQDDR